MKQPFTCAQGHRWELAVGPTDATLDGVPEADLAKPTQGRLARIAPTIADVFLLWANHPMMHVGQWAVVRRKLGKPVVI